MLGFHFRAAPLLALIACGCGNAANPADKAQSAIASTVQNHGYGGIELGASLEKVLSKVDTQFYDPENIAACSMDMPLKGCILIWNNWAFPFVRKDGIPYRLNLIFNRQGLLESIDLVYSRRNGGVSRSDCLIIHNRTLNWLNKEYGELREDSFSVGKPRNVKSLLIVMHGPKVVESKMQISLITFHTGGDCNVDVGFSDFLGGR